MDSFLKVLETKANNKTSTFKNKSWLSFIVSIQEHVYSFYH